MRNSHAITVQSPFDLAVKENCGILGAACTGATHTMFVWLLVAKRLTACPPRIALRAVTTELLGMHSRFGGWAETVVFVAVWVVLEKRGGEERRGEIVGGGLRRVCM